MNITRGLSVTYQSSSTVANVRDDVWLELEQDDVSPASGKTDFSLLRDMITLAAAGVSARLAVSRSCPVAIGSSQVHVPLGFIAWVSDVDLPHSVSANMGTLSAGVLTRREVDLDVVVDFRASKDLPWITESARAEWQTGCWNRLGESVDPPEVTVSGSVLEVAAEVFGVLRLSGIALGMHYVLLLTFDRQTGYKITDVAPVVTATWSDDSGEAQARSLRLTVPDCVERHLAFCPNKVPMILVNTSEAEGDPIPVVYYDSCTGKQIGAVQYRRDTPSRGA